jgi:hypothetical protein
LSRAVLVLHSDEIRRKAVDWILRSEKDTRVEFYGPKRTLPQNARQWGLLTCISQQLVWHGQRYSKEDWRDFMMAAYRGHKWMPGEDGGMIPIGRSTSKLSKEEHSEFTLLIEVFCERNGVDTREAKNEEANDR